MFKIESPIEVQVPRAFEVCFPSICVVCGEETSQELAIQGGPVGHYGLWRWIFGLNQKLQLPCHSECGQSLKGSIRKRWLLLLFVAAIAVALSVILDWERIELLLLSAVVVTPIIMWQVHNVLPMEFYVEEEYIEFTFSDEQFAKQFAKLNHVQVIRD